MPNPVLRVMLPPLIELDVPQGARMGLVGGGSETQRSVFGAGCGQKTGHTIFMVHHAIVERSELSPETSPTPGLAVGWVRLDVEVAIGAGHAPRVDAVVEEVLEGIYGVYK